MKFSQMPTDSKASHSKKSAEEIIYHTKQEFDKFNHKLGVFEKNKVNEDVQRENFKNSGVEDLYDKHLKKKEDKVENEKAHERRKAMNEVEEKYEEFNNVNGAQLGTFAYEEKMNELIKLAKERKLYYQGTEEDHKKAEEDIQKRIEANNAVLEKRISMMDSTDVERVGYINERNQDIKKERIENSGIVYGVGINSNDKDLAAKRNIELEKEENSLHLEREQMFNEKYKGLGEI